VDRTLSAASRLDEFVDLLSEQERLVLERAGYAASGAVAWGRRPFGRRPVLLVVDMQRNAVGSNVPIEEAVLEHRTAMGERAHAALPHIEGLLRTVRDAAVPVIFTRLVPSGKDSAAPEYALVESLAPRPDETIVVKEGASAFFATPLAAQLIRLGADTVVLAGNSTSGCVRATAVDAHQHGFAPVVVPECTFDRIDVSHRVALLDMWMKYAVLASVAEVGALLAR
jgi:nicotinamidase-related amidase